MGSAAQSASDVKEVNTQTEVKKRMKIYLKKYLQKHVFTSYN